MRNHDLRSDDEKYQPNKSLVRTQKHRAAQFRVTNIDLCFKA
jgi:hypothetical protein